MKNLKIRVANKAESKEAQELLDILGYSKGAFENKSTPCWIAICDGLTYSDYNIGKNIWYTACPKEITLQELRDMVNPMKEYLVKTDSGSYLYTKNVSDIDAERVIEVPEGATHYATDSNSGIKKNYFFRCPNDAIWVDSQWMSASFSVAGQTVLWQRHVQPEELPFIDDEPKIETATGYQLDVVGKNTYGSRSRESGESDTSYRQYLMNFKIDQSKSLNDQYAEIEQVRQHSIEATLAERQAQYGCFEDVARTTGKIMEALSEVRVNGLNDLPYPHRMALYMIASKMARIVNGDFNYRDNWHDIGGYSKLIEDLL